MSERQPPSTVTTGDPTSVRLIADMLSDAERFLIEIELPGVLPEELEVSAQGESLIVEGVKEERRPPRGERPLYERAERDYGSFRRVFSLPGPADLSRATAALAGGILRISIPRIEDRRGRSRRIQVVVGESERRERSTIDPESLARRAKGLMAKP
jgi:HSP20 family protein